MLDRGGRHATVGDLGTGSEPADFGAEWLVTDWGGLGSVLGGSLEDERPRPEVSMSVLRAVKGVPTDAECMIEDATGVPGLPETASSAEWQAAFLVSAEAQRHPTTGSPSLRPSSSWPRRSRREPCDIC